MGQGQSTEAAHAEPAPIEDAPVACAGRCETCACGHTVALEGAYNPKLVGTVKLYDRHIIICDGREDWVEKIVKEEGSVAAAIQGAIKACGDRVTSKPLLTACSEHPSGAHGVDIIVYPEGVRYFDVDADAVPAFVEDQIVQGRICESLRHGPVEFEHLVLVCTHGTRDKRCGRAGPQVVDALRELLSERNVADSRVAVRGSSHLGGHKHAGVVTVYPHGDWYGQMTAKNASELIDAYLGPGHRYHRSWRGKMGVGKEETQAQYADVIAQKGAQK